MILCRRCAHPQANHHSHFGACAAAARITTLPCSCPKFLVPNESGDDPHSPHTGADAARDRAVANETGAL
ncbi:hypothetical protein JGU71_28380 [Antrihabitans sp. YC3-6]|uniref:Uncharacterized protein n=1 Tax=Antrihabitans stalagmiti TaxID=2799499 RepID=A0A934NX04_9NOCA|nr:hypothetical protein [Antrihabitans stalagmiti]MBJ8342814.1 hypothetical protein [Antrihabitans stalagmiti]